MAATTLTPDKKDRRIAELEATVEALKKNQAKTKFLDYLSLVDLHVFGKFSVETNRALLTRGTTSVAGKCCPRRLRPWSAFPGLHDEKFKALEDALNPLDASFDSPLMVESYDSAFSPKINSEAALRPFLRIAVEKPAAAIVTAYLGAIGEQQIRRVAFKDDDKSTATDVLSGMTAEPGQKRKATSTDKFKGKGIPDRWGLCKFYSVLYVAVRFLVGEYKAAHRLPAATLQLLLANPPEDFFLKASRMDEQVNPENDGASDNSFSSKYPNVYLAKALCQAYHYMVTSALQYGYVATGDGLVLLYVSEEDKDVLHYHCLTFASERTPQQPLHPKQTAAAYLATLALLALRRERATTDEMARWTEGRHRWPNVRYGGNSGDRNDRDDPEGGGHGGGNSGGGGGGGGGGGSGNRGEGEEDHAGRDKRARFGSGTGLPSRHGGDDASGDLSSIQGWTRALSLPYCTQACLLGMVRQLPLDEKCPNVHLHRAAALRQHGQPDRHPLTLAGVHEQLQRQSVAAKDEAAQHGPYHDVQQRIMYCGREGRYGTLLRLTVDGAGYTFVAKGTFYYCRSTLEHEERIYDALRDCQGTLIPVCLGILSTTGDFTGDNLMTVMLLLSYAGMDLRHPERLPCNVNLQEAMDRTALDLYNHGLRNRDVRIHNCAWNDETRRVMHFDFDHADMVPLEEEGEEKEVGVEETREEREEREERVASSPQETKTRSPLLKRNLNALCKETVVDTTPEKKQEAHHNEAAARPAKRCQVHP